jgi:tetratricopeptide (TPR) repeat protein/predicted Ser/Thr protein kinase
MTTRNHEETGTSSNPVDAWTDVGNDISNQRLRDKIFSTVFNDEVTTTRLGRFILLDKLGEGGMGVVYSAYDAKLDRKVAVKLLRNRGSQPAAERLVREAQALARLSHPNIVQIYEIGEVEGHQFLVMELVRGLTLHAWLQGADRSQEEVLDVFIAAGRGLAAAHARGLVHRDFKPRNVMVADDERVVVMDFGIVRELSELSTSVAHLRMPEHVELTETGALMGTPAYMSPEQLQGLAIDERTDQFSFCVSLWEALNGVRPFGGSNLAQLTEAVLKGTIDDPGSTGVPRWLRNVIARGLAVQPGDRWPSMEDLLDALQRAPAHPWRWLKVGGALVGVVLGVVLFGGESGSDFVAHTASMIDRARIGAECRASAREIEETWNPKTRQQLDAVVAKLDDDAMLQTWTRLKAGLDTYAAKWTDIRHRTCVETRIDQTRDDATFADVTACLDEGRSMFAAGIDVLTSSDRPPVVVLLNSLAMVEDLSLCTDPNWLHYLLVLPDDPNKRAEVAQLRSALLQAAALGSPDFISIVQHTAKRAQELAWPPLHAEAMYIGGRALLSTGALEQARKLLTQAFNDGLASGHDLMALYAGIWLMSTETTAGNHDDAMRWSTHIDALIQRMRLANTSPHALYLLAKCNAQGAVSDFDGMLAASTQALEIYTRVFGTEHPQVAAAANQQGHAQRQLGDLQAALLSYQRALAIYDGGPMEHFPLVGMAKTHLALDQPNEARAALERAVTTLERARSTFNRSEQNHLARARFVYAQALWETGDRRAAHEQAAAARSWLATDNVDPVEVASIDAWLAKHPGDDAKANAGADN